MGAPVVRTRSSIVTRSSRRPPTLNTMTVSLCVAGKYVASVELDPMRDGRDLNRAVSLTHAVSMPVVDGLTSSVCGVLVTAMVDMDWHVVRGVPRCEECQRVAG